MDTIFMLRPWSINDNLVVLHEHYPEIPYNKLNWGHQCFWIQLKNLLPEFMKEKVIREMGNIMGDVIAIDPPNYIPADGELVKVCVTVDMNKPLRRGTLAIIVVGITRWVRYFYEKQPHKVCPNFYVINLSSKKMFSLVEAAHKNPHNFGVKGTLLCKSELNLVLSCKPEGLVEKDASLFPY